VRVDTFSALDKIEPVTGQAIPPSASSFFVSSCKRCSPAYLAGFSLPDWIRFLHRNHWQIDGRYLPRAIYATLRTAVTSMVKLFEDRVDLTGVGEEGWRKPVFIIGLPRSGTTHLFNLLARDTRFGFPSRFDVFNPHTFLTLRRLGLHRILARQPSVKRPMDAIKAGWDSPEEDNIALGVIAGRGPRVELVFPKRHAYADAFRPLEEQSENERIAFRKALAAFTRKLVYCHDRPLLLKSPAHAVCIADIMEVFPDARFVGIIRKPAAQLASLRHMHAVTSREKWAVLQDGPVITEEDLLSRIGHHVRAYCRARAAIRPENLVEVRYEELVADEEETLDRIYSCLGLTMPKQQVRRQNQEQYIPNRHAALEPALEAKLRTIYKPFEKLGLLNPERDW
jgi:hypothetical protein